MKRYVVAIAAVLLLAGPADAAAKHGPHAHRAQAGITGSGVPVRTLDQLRAENVAKSVAIARYVWRLDLPLDVRFETVPAEWHASDDVMSSIMAWAQRGNPVIRINRAIGDVSGRYFEPLCDTILHEAGHVAGFHSDGEDPAHSDNPRSVMYPTKNYGMARIWNGRGFTVKWSGVDRRCSNDFYNRITKGR